MQTAEEYKLAGNQAFAQKGFEKAIELYTKAIELDPSNVIYFSNRSGAFASLGQFDKALEDANVCLEKDYKYVKGYSRKGLALFKLGREDEALEVIEAGLKIEPDNQMLKSDKASIEASLNAGMGNLMGLLNNPEIQKLMKENPQLMGQLLQNPQMFQNPQMMQMMANLFSAKKKKSAPEEEQPSNPFTAEPPKEKPQSAPKAPPAPQDESEFARTKRQGNELYAAKRFEEALAAYDKCIELNPSDLLVRNNKAACFIELKKLDCALEALELAFEKYKELSFGEKDPRHFAKLAARKGRVLFLQGKFDESIAALSDSLLEDKVPAVEEQLREVRREKKRAEEQAYLSPELSDKHREAGNELFGKGEFGKALGEYEEARRRNPKDARVFNNIASCLVKMLKFNEALKEVERALELEPKFVKAMVKKASIHSFLKEYHKAIDVYKAALELEPGNKEAAEGLRATQIKISASMGDVNDEERLKRAMADPQIQVIMADPMVRIALEQMQANPRNIPEYLSDKSLGPKIEKLIQAGIIRMG